MIRSKGLKTLIIVMLLASTVHSQPQSSRLAGFYSLSNGKGTNLTLSPVTRSLLLRKENGTLLVKRDKQFEISTFETHKNNRVFTVVSKLDLKRNISRTEIFISEDKELYLDICNEDKKIIKLNAEISKILESSSESGSDIEDYLTPIIDPSCKNSLAKMSLFDLKNTVKNFFTESSSIHQCLSKINKSKDLLKGKEVTDGLLLLVSGYENDRALLKNSMTPKFSIKCEKFENPPYQAKFFENSIILPVVDNRIKPGPCQNLDSILVHEYIHKNGVKEETTVKGIENICLGTDNIEAQTKECSSNNAELTGYKSLDREITQKMAETLKSEQAALTPSVEKEIAKAPVKEVKVSDATWSSLANDPNATIPTAERNSIAATMNSNFESMSGSLNRALGATQTPALAANESPASSSSGSSSASSESTSSASRSPASSYERAERETYSSDNSKNSRGSRGSKESTGPSNEFHTVEEYIVDSKNAKDPRSFNIPGARQGASADRGQDQSVAATTRQGMSATASTGENPAEGSQVTNAGRARNSEIARSASGGDFAGGDVSSGGTASLPAQGSGPAPARSNRRQPASQGGGSSSNAFNGGNSVSSLKEQTLIRGSDYESITSNYRRRDFSNELHQQGVSIYIEKQGMSLGRSDAKIKFIDNGEYLRRAEGN